MVLAPVPAVELADSVGRGKGGLQSRPACGGEGAEQEAADAYVAQGISEGDTDRAKRLGLQTVREECLRGHDHHGDGDDGAEAHADDSGDTIGDDVASRPLLLDGARGVEVDLVRGQEGAEQAHRAEAVGGERLPLALIRGDGG